MQVFYGVKGEETDQDDCERIIKSIMNKFMQVGTIKHEKKYQIHSYPDIFVQSIYRFEKKISFLYM